MASLSPAVNSSAGMKRSREDDENQNQPSGPRVKKSRSALNEAAEELRSPWRPDSAIVTPVSEFNKPKYDSDDQSSMISEPGSPQDISMSSSDEDMDFGSFSQSPEDTLPIRAPPGSGSPWRDRVRQSRVATPFGPPKLSSGPPQAKTGVRHHIRQRHPQEVFSSDHLEVPSPIDEDEMPTPPSAAEAAGSQLSMLSVSDMDVETADEIPAITLDPARGLQLEGDSLGYRHMGAEPIDTHLDMVVRKQRSRSGAQSNGSMTPTKSESDEVLGVARRGFSMGFRADCEKCRMRVPGHMNHFTL